MSADDEELTPRPAALIESLRSFGYTPATSVADLIDNSLSAGSSRIDVRFKWDGPDSYLLIVDNGHGMDEPTLREAMRAGSANPLDPRSGSDLGRFGLGLKTASFAQARSLTVISRREGRTSTRRWDLDHVQRTDRWSLLASAPDQYPNLESELFEGDGTLVAWHMVDRIIDDRPTTDTRAEKAFHRMVDEVRSHLEMVFHRFIAEDDLDLRVNGVRCEAWDPFLSENPATEPRQDESLLVSLPGGRTQQVTVRPYVLPHRSRLTSEEHHAAAGPRGWNLQQGFYLYRARRLIVPGDWFDREMKPEEHHKLARIRVEIAQEMDGMWALDVRKSRARPPGPLRRDFQRIARATREYAESVYRARGRREVGQSQRQHHRVDAIWRVETDDRTIAYTINRSHPSLDATFEGLKQQDRRRIDNLLRLIERALPVGHILSMGFRDEARLSDPEDVDETVIDAARLLFCHLIESGVAPDAARERLATLQPFDRAPGVIDALEKGDCL